MNKLPSSIESYMRDSGFTATELLVIKHLLSEDNMSLRQLASKSGKSTGVLDQSTRKLLNKDIICKESINNSPKYVIASLNAIVQWVQEDMKEKREVLLRKYQNFESFVANLKLDRTRPEMKYYDGWEGLKQAYTKLIEHKQEIVGFIPVTYNETDDPLRDFRVEYFRERRRLGLFQRTIVHDTPLGRRYECRDHFEYRKTLLVSESEYPFVCEKLVTGNVIAWIDYQKQRACLISHPELAQNERMFFEKIWQETLCKQQGACKEITPESSAAPAEVPLATRTGSNLREFFLGKSSLVTLGVFAVAALAITYGMYRHNASQNTERVRDQARAIAIAAAPRFDAKDLDQLHTMADIKKPVYAKVIKTLNEIRWEQNNIRYAYLQRPTSTPNMWEFIADADSIDPLARIDLNADGKIDAADALSTPGEPFDMTQLPGMTATLQGKIYVDSTAYSDQWGTWISGVAPIFRDDGSVAGVVAVDIDAREISSMTARTFVPLLYIIALFFLFFFIRFSAANKALTKEIFMVLHKRKILIAIAASLLFSSTATFGLQRYTSALNLKRIQERVQSIAITGAPLLNAKDVAALQTEEDWKKPEWAKVVNTLKDIRLMNEDITFTYIFRRDPVDPHKIIFVADSHSLNPYANSDSDTANDVDANSDDKIEPDGPDKLQWPGQIYDTVPPEALEAFAKPSVSKPYADTWGAYISGYAPIKNKNGDVIGVFAVDVKTKQLMDMNRNTLEPIQYFVVLSLLFLVLALSLLNPAMLKPLLQKVVSRRFIYVLSYGVVVIAVGGYIWHVRSVREEQERAGERLMTIAATAASQFDPADLNQLHKAGDMKTEAYQRVFTKLNEIREANPGITYAYLMRPTGQTDVWEFIADADSNYNLPFWSDSNNDGVLTAEDDECIWPGQSYVPPDPSMYRKTLLSAGHNVGNEDQWGNFITGYAPIYEDGKAIAIIEIDISTP